jgi:hypothetical protein
MKRLSDYLSESKKVYPFKIGIAGTLPEGTPDHLKTMLEKFGVQSFSKGKKTPIQERPLDFPNLQNQEVTYFEVELTYPTTDAVLQEYVGSVCSVPRSHIVVRNPNTPLERIQNAEENSEYEPLLSKEELGGTSAQQMAGQSRVMDLLKELETARKEQGDSGFKLESNKDTVSIKSILGNKK